MKVLNPMRWGTALAAGLIATVTLLPQAKGQLVYENNSATAAAENVNAQVEDRTTMRQALGASEKAQVTQAAALETAPAPAATETEHLSKAELIRRERQREELKNEDVLQERLEELRLRDERRRTDEVLGASNASSGPAAASTIQTAPLKEEAVVAPVTDHPGKPSLAPAMASTQSTGPAPAGDAMQTSISLAPGADGVEDPSERTLISIAPRVGLSNMVGESGYFQISPRFSAGLFAELGTGDYFSFQVGYTFSQYGISMLSSNFFANQQAAQAALYGQNLPTLNMNQNLFDAGAKIHVLGVASKIRPFFGAGGAYGISYVNFSQSILSQMRAYYPNMAQVSPDYTLKNFLGYLSAGSDFRVSKHISVGAEFRYYAVLSDSESSNVLGMFYGMYGGINPMNQDTAIAGASLARTNFYSILGNVTFTF